MCARSKIDARLSRRLTGANPRGVRLLDVLGAFAGLSVLSPVLIALGVAVRLTSSGPALFQTTRAGQFGRPFVLYKFRSMVAEAPGVGPAITAASDPRVVPLGAILRRLKLDELPQLLNVLMGDMSLVGPRPEDYRYVALYTREQLEILDAKPGMTSLASLRYRDEAAQLLGTDWNDRYIHEIMPAKLAIDKQYLDRRTVWSDALLILETVRSLVGSAIAKGDGHETS